jgi:hypothetical protein
MDRLFLDANVLFSAAYRPNAGLRQLWKLSDVVLCTSHHALEEARINLAEPGQREALDRLAKDLKYFDVFDGELPAGISLPEKDVPIMLSAIGARATHLPMGDLRHFGRYFGRRIGGVLVLPPASYLQTRV